MAEKEKDEKVNQEIDERTSLEQIRQECLDAPGYVMFVGILQRNRDAKGFNLIDFKYRRYNYSFEDVRKSVKEFERALEKDENGQE